MFTVLTKFIYSFLNLNQDKCREENLKSLRLLHVVFRHGKRTGIPTSSYPNDPHKKHEFLPYGPGALTKDGKLGAYKMGLEIRRNYGKFLSNKLLPDQVIAISSNKHRCQTSLMAVMAGLFPPNRREKFYKKLNWQPIAFTVPIEDQDRIFAKYHNYAFKKAYKKLQKNVDTVLLHELYEPVFDYTSLHTGKKICTFMDLFYLYDGLKVQKELGLCLPKWTKKVFPKPLEDLATIVYQECTKTLEMRRLTIEYLLRKIVAQMESKILKTIKKRTKIFLYSAHDVQVMSLLIVLGFPRVEMPPYSSYVALELHEKDCSFFVRVLYQNYSTKEPEVVRVNGKEFCPFEEFLLYVDQKFTVDEYL